MTWTSLMQSQQLATAPVSEIPRAELQKLQSSGDVSVSAPWLTNNNAGARGLDEELPLFTEKKECLTSLIHLCTPLLSSSPLSCKLDKSTPILACMPHYSPISNTSLLPGLGSFIIRRWKLMSIWAICLVVTRLYQLTLPVLKVFYHDRVMNLLQRGSVDSLLEQHSNTL